MKAMCMNENDVVILINININVCNNVFNVCESNVKMT